MSKYPDLRSIPKRQRRGVGPNVRVSARSIHLFPSGAELRRARGECMVLNAAFGFNRFLSLKTRLSWWWNGGKHKPLASFDPQTGQPVLAGVPEGANFCRTRHRRATILWSIYRSSGTCQVVRVRNVLIATGKRIEVI